MDFVSFTRNTLWSQSDEKSSLMKFRVYKLFIYSHGRTNSCGVATGYFGSKPFTVINQMADQNGCILITERKVNDEIYVLANI